VEPHHKKATLRKINKELSKRGERRRLERSFFSNKGKNVGPEEATYEEKIKKKETSRRARVCKGRELREENVLKLSENRSEGKRITAKEGKSCRKA